MTKGIGIKYWEWSGLGGTEHIDCDLGQITLFVQIKQGLFAFILIDTCEGNNNTQDNESNPCSKNTPISLSIKK